MEKKEDKVIEVLGNCVGCGTAVSKKEQKLNDVKNEYIEGHQFENKNVLCNECIDNVAEEKGYGYCDDCDERVPEESMYNEGYL